MSYHCYFSTVPWVAQALNGRKECLHLLFVYVWTSSHLQVCFRCIWERVWYCCHKLIRRRVAFKLHYFWQAITKGGQPPWVRLLEQLVKFGHESKLAVKHRLILVLELIKKLRICQRYVTSHCELLSDPRINNNSQFWEVRMVLKAVICGLQSATHWWDHYRFKVKLLEMLWSCFTLLDSLRTQRGVNVFGVPEVLDPFG